MLSLPDSALLAVLVLVATICLIAWRPRAIGEGIAATFGAGLMVALGWASLRDVEETARATSGILLFLVGMMVVAVVVDAAGFFDRAADWAIRAAAGHGRRLYVYLYLLGAAITLFLSLDVTAIIFTPIVCASALRLRLKPAPFVFASAFVANTASLTLPVSNLTNMLVYDLLGVNFWSFVRCMALPNLAALAVNLVFFLVLFRSDIPARFERPAASEKAPSGWFLVVSTAGLAVIVGLLLVSGFLDWPLYAVALGGAAALATIGLVGRQVSLSTLSKGVAWQLPLFVVGMYVVVLGVNRAAFAPVWSQLVGLSAARPDVGVFLIAFTTGLGANLVNNIPMSLVAITALSGQSAQRELLSFATVIGTNLGPNISVFGSLATMLVLSAARQRGVEIAPGQYLKIGLLTTPPMIFAAALLLLASAS